MKGIDEAIEELKGGRPILVYDSDGREEETDIVIAAEFATPEFVRMLRKDGGGLLCLSLHPEICNKLRIPFLTDVWKEASQRFPVFTDLWPNDIPYDEKSAFSITINHRKTFTGISDFDRSFTVTELARLGKRILNGTYAVDEFGKEFRSPGHIILLRAAEGLLEKRKGHTELSVSLMEMAGLTPMAAICEMLADDHRSLGVKEARLFAGKNDLAFIEGKEAIRWSLKKGRALVPKLKS
jgi:3,4-dihydroxy 2-butanone 4-phosphate synthase